jgi:hypothetical protein
MLFREIQRLIAEKKFGATAKIIYTKTHKI